MPFQGWSPKAGCFYNGQSTFRLWSVYWCRLQDADSGKAFCDWRPVNERFSLVIVSKLWSEWTTVHMLIKNIFPIRLQAMALASNRTLLSPQISLSWSVSTNLMDLWTCCMISGIRWYPAVKEASQSQRWVWYKLTNQRCYHFDDVHSRKWIYLNSLMTHFLSNQEWHIEGAVYF